MLRDWTIGDAIITIEASIASLVAQHSFLSFERARRELECMDPLVQGGAPAPGARLSEPARIPGARSRSGGLIPGEHYSHVLLGNDEVGPRGFSMVTKTGK